MPTKPVRPRIVVVVGLPASGKSTYLERERLPSLSSDHMRYLLAEDENDQSIHRHVFAALRYLLRRRIAIGREVTYVDATNLTPIERRPYLEMGERYGCEVEALFFDVPVEVCKERNRRRARRVPEQVIDDMARRLVPPTRAEGFSRVRVVGG